MKSSGFRRTGEVLQNRFVIEEILGQGGMGVVYLARHQLVEGRQVAIKQVRLRPRDRDKAIAQFRREATLLSRLQHPNLVRLLDFFEEDGQPFLVMEYIDGQSLDQFLQAGVACGEAQVLVWARELADALTYLHSQDPPILFRDLKPSNVMIDQCGSVRLIDFGIARVVANDDTSTASGSMGYAAPEQYRGKTDVRSEVYSYGATLYTMLTLEIPILSVGRVVEDSLVPPSQLNPAVSASIESAVLRMMAVDPAQRPQSITAAWAALSDTGSMPRLVPPAAPPRPTAGLMAVSGAVLGLLALAGTSWAWLHRTRVAVVTSFPPGAAVLDADNHRLGTTPFTLHSAADTVELQLTLPGYQSVKARVRPADGNPLPFDMPPAALQWSVSTNAQHATIVVNDKSYPLPQGGVMVPVDAGPNSIHVRADDYQPVSMATTFAANSHPAAHTFTLKPLPSRVEVSSVAGSTLIVNQVHYRERVTLKAAGEYLVQVSAPGYQPHVEKVVVQPGDDARRAINLQPVAAVAVVAPSAVTPTATVTVEPSPPLQAEASTAPSAAPASDGWDGDHVLVPHQRYGNIVLGVAASEFQRKYPDVKLKVDAPDARGYTAAHGHYFNVSINEDGTLVGVWTVDRRAVTAEGVHMGYRLENLVATLGEPEHSKPFPEGTRWVYYAEQGYDFWLGQSGKLYSMGTKL